MIDWARDMRDYWDMSEEVTGLGGVGLASGVIVWDNRRARWVFMIIN